MVEFRDSENLCFRRKITKKARQRLIQRAGMKKKRRRRRWRRRRQRTQSAQSVSFLCIPSFLSLTELATSSSSSSTRRCGALPAAAAAAPLAPASMLFESVCFVFVCAEAEILEKKKTLFFLFLFCEKKPRHENEKAFFFPLFFFCYKKFRRAEFQTRKRMN